MAGSVVFTVSHIHSGSTWLSLMLSSHSAAFYNGEDDSQLTSKILRDRG